ncbi:MAG: ankyrin repeat domain-containing protein [Gammaproteobacteria bacterium]|nr:ankyrin repeat domain-containing protein [Gammaproteobacteria bacterium]
MSRNKEFKLTNEKLDHCTDEQMLQAMRAGDPKEIDKLNYAWDYFNQIMKISPNNTDARFLHEAIYDSPAIVEYLLAKGANPNSKDYDNATPLHYVLKKDDRNEEEILRRLQIVELLLKNGANINAQTKEYGDTPLHIAVQNSYCTEKFIKLLLLYGANPHTKNKAGRTSLDNCLYFRKDILEEHELQIRKAPLQINALEIKCHDLERSNAELQEEQKKLLSQVNIMQNQFQDFKTKLNFQSTIENTEQKTSSIKRFGTVY